MGETGENRKDAKSAKDAKKYKKKAEDTLFVFSPRFAIFAPFASLRFSPVCRLKDGDCEH
jgi:hypothetical protein